MSQQRFKQALILLGLLTLIFLGAIVWPTMSPIVRYEASLAQARYLNISVDKLESMRRILAEIGQTPDDLKPEHMLPLVEQCRFLKISDPHRPQICDVIRPTP